MFSARRDASPLTPRRRAAPPRGRSTATKLGRQASSRIRMKTSDADADATRTLRMRMRMWMAGAAGLRMRMRMRMEDSLGYGCGCGCGCGCRGGCGCGCRCRVFLRMRMQMQSFLRMQLQMPAAFLGYPGQDLFNEQKFVECNHKRTLLLSADAQSLWTDAWGQGDLCSSYISDDDSLLRWIQLQRSNQSKVN